MNDYDVNREVISICYLKSTSFVSGHSLLARYDAMLWMVMGLYIAVAALVVVALFCASRGQLVRTSTEEPHRAAPANASSPQPKIVELSLKKTQTPCESSEIKALKTAVAPNKCPSSKLSNSNEHTATAGENSKKNGEQKKTRGNEPVVSLL
ncbi:hypothetical protein Y032_0363g3526 [Ancylostoma ceylanicum]|uniref:Uncharacterized protein n=1 Tax=Ancylostoma ceylanicum TaxID=53326 RepID=A0A016RW92_9BILA|nr:hypothetical protein Y032_0363g3526 [Ancylostoma ceylanicum]